MTNSNIPDVHALDREIPPGKVLLAQPGSDPKPMADRTVLDRFVRGDGIEVRLEAVTAGWAVAGSTMRWDNGYFGVFWMIDGNRHGQRFERFDEAADFFRKKRPGG